MAGTNATGWGRVVLASRARFDGVKVFSATMGRERIGDAVTEWMIANRHLRFTEVVVTQSSDDGFHCIAITVFYAAPVT